MGHRRHYSHESDHHTKSNGPKAPTSRSKSYPRDERHRKDSSERREHRQHKHKSKKTEYLVEKHPSKRHHKEKKKHEKSEKDKYNTEKYLKEKHNKYHIGHNQQHIIRNETPKHSHKAREPTPKRGSYLDLMNIEYCVAPLQVKPDKEKFRSKSGGGDKRQKVKEHIVISNKEHSKSQEDCKQQKDYKKHSKTQRTITPQELSSSPRRSHREKYKEKPEKRRRNKDKYSSKPGSSRRPIDKAPLSPDRLYSGLYKFFRIEKSADHQEVDQVKHNVSSDEFLLARNESFNQRKKPSDRDRRKHNDEFQKKSEENMKEYFLQIQNLIDEKLNSFLRRNASIPSTYQQQSLSPNNQINDHHHNREKENENQRKPKEIRRSVSPEPIKIPIIMLDDDRQNEIFTEEIVKCEASDENQSVHRQKSTTTKEIISSENFSPPINNISDERGSPKKSKTTVVTAIIKNISPQKVLRNLECKTLSIVSIAPQEEKERIRKVIVKSGDMVEEVVEKKKKSKRFKKYYSYGTENRREDTYSSISSGEKSIVSDSFKNVQDDSNDIQDLPTTNFNQSIVNNEDVQMKLPPYWTDNNGNVWKPHGIFENFDSEINRLNLKQDYNFFNYNNNSIEPNKRRSRADDGFIKVFSNRRLRCKESSSDSLVSKSSDQTKLNVRLILGPLQSTRDSKKVLINNNNNNHTHQSYMEKATLEYQDYKNYLKNQQAEDRMSRIEKLLNETIYLEDASLEKQPPATFTLPRTFISKLLEKVSEKKTSEVGVGTNEDDCDTEEKNNKDSSPPKEKTWSHFSVQANLSDPEIVSRHSINPQEQVQSSEKTTKDVAVDTQTPYLDHQIPKKAATNHVKDQYAQISNYQLFECEQVNKKHVKYNTSTRSFGISTSMPFLRDPRRTNIKPGSVTNESTVASLICLHRFHADRISSSNKSNSHSLNDYFIKPLIGNSPRKSSLFLTKQYRTSEQSSYQKRKIYDEKMRRRMKKRFQHNKEFTPPVFEVRFVTVENTSSQSNPFSSSKEISRDYVHPNFEKVIQKTKRKIVKKRYSRNLISYAIRDVDMLWKSKKKKVQKQEQIEEKSTSFVGPDSEQLPRKSGNIPDLKGVIDFICKSLVTYYHNNNFKEPSNETSAKKLRSKKTLEELYYSDHFQKESSASNSLTEVDCRSSVSDSKYTKSTDLTSASNPKCMCFNNSCPTLNSADSFFEYPNLTEKNINPTILGYALDNKTPPAESYRKKESYNDISFSAESGYGSDRIKSDLSKNFFKKPNIAALLLPNNDGKTLTRLFSYQEGASQCYRQLLKVKNSESSGIGSAQMDEKDSNDTLAGKSWSNNFDSDCLISFQNQNENLPQSVLEEARYPKQNDNAIEKNVESVKHNKNHEAFSRNIFESRNISNLNKEESKIKSSITKFQTNILKNEENKYQKFSNRNDEQISSMNNNVSRENLESSKYTKVEQQEMKRQTEETQTVQIRSSAQLELPEGEVKESSLFIHEKSSNKILIMEKDCIENMSKNVQIDVETPVISDMEILKPDQSKKCSQNKTHNSFNCLCCKPSTEDQLFALIERDLREIYEPSSSKSEINTKTSITSRCKRFFGIIFGGERKKIKNIIGRK